MTTKYHSPEKYLRICNTDACHRAMGIKATHLDSETGMIELVLRKKHLNYENCVHGGVLSFLLDTAMGLCVYPHLTVAERILAIDLKIVYLRAALFEMKKITAQTRLISRTRRLAVAEGTVFAPDGKPLTKGIGTYAILAEKHK